MLPYQPKDLPVLEITAPLEPQGQRYNVLQRANSTPETSAWRTKKKKEVLLFMESVYKLKVNQTNPLVHSFPVQGINTLPDFLSLLD